MNRYSAKIRSIAMGHMPRYSLGRGDTSDHLLSVSGNWKRKCLEQVSVSTRAPKNDRRRGIYVQTKRQSQNELFSVFDVPTPTTTRGTRDLTTTPAQAAALLNSPFVWYQAHRWSIAHLKREPDLSDDERIRRLIENAFTRSAQEDEVRALEAFLNDCRSEKDSDQRGRVAHHWFQYERISLPPLARL